MKYFLMFISSKHAIKNTNPFFYRIQTYPKCLPNSNNSLKEYIEYYKFQQKKKSVLRLRCVKKNTKPPI